MRLAEYLIGMSTLIPMPQNYWSDDGVKWSVNVKEHRVSKRHQGGHVFQVLLAESKPAYTADDSDSTFAVELSAKQMRTGIEREYVKGKTLEQMFDTKYVQPTNIMSAKQMRTGVEREYGKGKTLEQMFDTKYVQPTSALAQTALGMTRTIITGFQKGKK